MTLAAKALVAAPLAVRHATRGEGRPSGQPDPELRSCAGCGNPVPLITPSGRRRSGARFCTSRCRFSAVADRRAAARADLLDALFQLAEAEARIRRALSVLGLNPKKPRAKRGRR